MGPLTLSTSSNTFKERYPHNILSFYSRHQPSAALQIILTAMTSTGNGHFIATIYPFWNTGQRFCTLEIWNAFRHHAIYEASGSGSTGRNCTALPTYPNFNIFDPDV